MSLRSLCRTAVSDMDWPGPRPGAAVLFLDFDGVLHPGRSGCYRHMPALERLLARFPQLDVVLTTGHREVVGREELLGPFPAAIRDRVRDVTPVLSAPWPRYAEILTYVCRHGIRRWIAVDDDRDLFPENCENVFFVDRWVALAPENEAGLAERLAGLFGGGSLEPVPC